jgi:ABC-type multidrug transport system ATPase subunit
MSEQRRMPGHRKRVEQSFGFLFGQFRREIFQRMTGDENVNFLKRCHPNYPSEEFSEKWERILNPLRHNSSESSCTSC